MRDQTKFNNYVREMRSYQKDYFKFQAMARKNPQYWPDAKHALSKSKQFEIDVDHMLVEAEKHDDHLYAQKIISDSEKEVQNG